MMLTRTDRDAIDGLFDRLADADGKGGPRDAEAEALIRDKIARQPAAPYYLAQTVVVQQEALNQAERRIEELESERGHRRQPARRSPWDGPQQGYGYGSGGFLAGAAQTALGVAGGVLLGSMIGGLFGAGSAHASEAQPDSDTGGDSGNDASDAGNDNGFDGDGGGFDSGGFDMGGDF